MAVHRLTLAVAALVSLGPVAGRVCAQWTAADPTHGSGPGVTFADDAYHYAEWADGRQDVAYTEWWYFNVFDARSGVKAIFSYFVTDPADKLGQGQSRMVAVAYTPRGVVSAIDGFAPGAFSASDRRADVTIDANTIRVGGDGTYRVRGRSLDGRLEWDLAFEAEALPWLAADRLQVGRAAWERMSWLVFMPRARVVGQVRVDERTFEVDAPGYHDHNWGEWVPTHALWNWAQYSDERVAIEVGDFIGKPVGRVAIDVDGARAVFTPGQYSLTHTRWARDRTNGGSYPVESVLVAENDAVRVEVTLRAAQTEPLRGDLPFPLADVIIYEQTARYKGQVWRRTPAGTWETLAPFAGRGFKEYTATRY
jgi:predicted secreted hydrolase